MSRPIVYGLVLDIETHYEKTWDAAAHVTSCPECKAMVPQVIANMMAIIDRMRYRGGEWAPAK